MKKRFLVFWLLCCLLTGFASANPIVVRSGNHDGFTRLVMQLPPEVQWEVSSVPGRQTLSFLGYEGGFDISRVFDFIPRDYLKEIAAYPSKLELELACNCETEFFIEKGSFLVVDIIDGPPLSVNVLRTGVAHTRVRPQSNFAFGELLWQNRNGDEDQVLVARKEQDVEPNSGNPNAAGLSPQEADTVKATHRRLLKSVADATSRGIVEPSTPRLDAVKKSAVPERQPQIFDSSDQTDSTIRNEVSHLRVTNSRDLPEYVEDVDLMSSGVVCAEADAVNVPSWGGASDFHQQVSTLRRSLYSEIGRLDENIAVDLARTYVFFGFGAEAKETLRLSENLVFEHPALMDLADIVDFGFAGNPRFVHKYSDCDSDLALWSILAAKTFANDQIANDNAALRALAKLPSHLRDFLAPILSQRFAKMGKTDAASIALRRLNLDERESVPNAELAKAHIENSSGNTASATKILSDLSNTNSIESPEALILYVENKRTNLAPIEANVALLTDAYAFELQDSPLGYELFRTNVVASALSGQFEKAFEIIRTSLSDQSVEDKGELQSTVFAALGENASDVEFLDIVFEHFPDNSNAMQLSSVLAVAKRMQSLGFANDAAKMLVDIDDNYKDLETKLLEAEVYLDLKKPDKTLEILHTISGRDADVIRAQALLRIGENARAFQLFQAANMSETAKRAAWLADEWVELTPQQSATFSGIRNLAEAAIDPVSVEDGMVSATQTALDESASARAIVTDLLKNLTVD